MAASFSRARAVRSSEISKEGLRLLRADVMSVFGGLTLCGLEQLASGPRMKREGLE